MFGSLAQVKYCRHRSLLSSLINFTGKITIFVFIPQSYVIFMHFFFIIKDGCGDSSELQLNVNC